MPVPVATHRVQILRAATDPTTRDSFDGPTVFAPIARNVRAVIAAQSGSERTARAEAETRTAVLSCDEFDGQLTHLDRVSDDTGTVWRVLWAVWRAGLGLDHWEAGLVRYDGQEP